MSNPWNDEKIERARRLWMQGYAISEICGRVRGVNFRQVHAKLAAIGALSSEARALREQTRTRRFGFPISRPKA